MNAYVISLSDTQATLENVGGKGMSLAKMINAGFPIPDGFHVTTEAYRQCVAANNLQVKILSALKEVNTSLPATLEAASQTIRTGFEHSRIPADLSDAIMDAYQARGHDHEVVAVRSSATAEDLPEASFAGQQETYLNVHGIDEVLDAVKKCWASLWTARAIAYRIKNNIDENTVALAVVVQEMMNAEASGIVFTANPINGRRDEMVINAAWGLGEAIVGGLVSPDTIVADKATGKVKKYDVAEKTVITVLMESGTREEPLDEARRSAQVLNEADVAALTDIARQIENFYGKPQDIEWCRAASPSLSGSPTGVLRKGARAEGGFYIVQSRPITALPEAPIEWIPPDPKGTYMRTSIADLMPKPLSPLFVTMGIPTLREQMNPLAKRVIGGNPDLGQDYFTNINTYAYMNSNFPVRGWLWVLFRLLPAYPGLIRGLVPFWRNELHPEYQAFVAVKQDLSPAQMSADELWSETQALFEAAAFYMDGLMFATMGASAGSEMLLTRAYNKMAKQDGDPEPATMLMGWDNIPVRSEKSLYDIAIWARENGELAKYLLETPTADLAAQISSLPVREGPGVMDFSEFTVRLHKHLDTFGHVVFQLDFAEDLPLEHPEMMVETIKMYLCGEGTNPYERQQTSEQRRVETTETILNRLKGIKLWLFRKVLNWAQSLSEVREDALAEIGLAYPKIRQLLHELGQRLVEAGAIESAGDIFWLEKDEINTCVEKLERDQALENLSAHVEERKAFHLKARRVTPPPMIPMKERVMGFKSDIFIAQTEEAQTGNLLKGVPTSAGIVTAPACVLHGPDDFDQMHTGDVLVAGTTTPAWTPLFAMASAVVTDIGGPLSHGSIVAREYGIPAVMGTGVATKRIQSGQTITVDGTQGEVTLETGKEEQTTVVAPPTEWPVPGKGATFARGSLAEHTPSPVSPLFASLGLRIANIETERLWKEFMGIADPTSMFVGKGFYLAINNYVYGGFRMNMKNAWAMVKMSFSTIGPMMREAPDRWMAARDKFADVVREWEQKEINALSPSELLDGTRTVFRAACAYYTVIQSTLPAASMGEIFFTRFYNSLVKRKNDPDATVFLFGFDSMLVRAEKSLFDIATWLKGNPVLADYALRTPTEKLVTDFKEKAPPEGILADLWAEYRSRFEQHFEGFGRTAYEFDFANPTPAEAPSPQFDAVKLFVEGKAESPYQRLQTAREKREQATRSVLERIGWPRKGWFEKLLNKAHETGTIRENSIFDMGMGHPIIRRMLGLLGDQFVAGGAIENAKDIYWLEEGEVETLIASLEEGEQLQGFSGHVPEHKAQWQAALHIVPPVMLPERSFWQRFIGGGKPVEKDGKTVLKGIGTSSGKVTAPACVLYGPDDFPKMKPGDVLVATTTTPAWTPLFAMASAVVTDIGGPLSHSSIVAREYGIPAVMAARNATHHIKSGQMVTVDGKEGTVILENHH